MMKGFAPTSYENLGARLSIRFALFYIAAVIVSVLTSMRGSVFFTTEHVEFTAFLFVPLAIIAAFLTISNTYLMVLTLIKGFFDTHLLFRVTLFVKTGHVGFLEWNGCFFLTAASFILFLLVAVNAARFSFENSTRDLTLILSKPFLKYFTQSLFFMAFATLLYLLWPRLLALMPML